MIDKNAEQRLREITFFKFIIKTDKLYVINNFYKIHNHFLDNVGNTPSNDESEEY